jgi:hypothetical protein
MAPRRSALTTRTPRPRPLCTRLRFALVRGSDTVSAADVPEVKCHIRQRVRSVAVSALAPNALGIAWAG